MEHHQECTGYVPNENIISHASQLYVHTEFAPMLQAYTVPAQPTSRVCSACYTSNPHAVWLTWLPCSVRGHGTAKVTVVISNDGQRLLPVRDPPSAAMKANLAQMSYHPDCRSARCPSPHSPEERDYWRWFILKRRMGDALASRMVCN